MKPSRDEYNDIFTQDDAAGFEFTCGSRHLGRSRPISKNEMSKFEPTKRGNEEDVPLFVKCRDCGAYMDYMKRSMGDLSGKWICPECGTGVRERSVFRQLERENEKYLQELESSDYDEFW